MPSRHKSLVLLGLCLWGATSNPELYLGLGDCRLENAQPKLPSSWRMPNASNTRIQLSSIDTWCLQVDYNNFRTNPTVEHIDVVLTDCGKNVKWNSTDDPQAFSFDDASGQIRSLWSNTSGFCVGQDLTLVQCNSTAAVAGNSLSWKHDAATGQLHNLAAFPLWASCVVAVDIDFQNQGGLNCTSPPGHALPFCNATLPIPERLANLMTHLLWSRELIAGTGGQVRRLGIPKSPTGECLHGFGEFTRTAPTCLDPHSL